MKMTKGTKISKHPRNVSLYQTFKLIVQNHQYDIFTISKKNQIRNSKFYMHVDASSENKKWRNAAGYSTVHSAIHLQV